MVNSESDNDHTRHNERITPRPAILIPATGVGNDGQIRQMGKSGPRFVAASFPLAGKDDLPGYADWGLEPIEYVREFNGRYLSLNSVERRELETQTTKADRDTLHGLLRLRATTVDPRSSQENLSAATSLLIQNTRLQAAFRTGQVPQVAEWFFPAFFNRELKDVRLVLWLTKRQQFVPAIWCPTMKAAMFAFAAFRRVAACRHCGGLFTLDTARIDGSGGETYCAAVCGQRYRQRQYRLRCESKRVSQRRKTKKRRPKRANKHL